MEIAISKCRAKVLVNERNEFNARTVKLFRPMPVLKKRPFNVDDIYVPVKRRKTLKTEIVNEIAESMLENGQLTPILVRQGSNRFVLVEGLHRLEACRALGEETIVGMIVQAPLH